MSTLTLDSILNPAPLQVAKTITATPEEAAAITFQDFQISDSLKARLSAAGFVHPTPVQAGAIPPALEGDDILATASTGTGKTLSFLIPMIERLEEISEPSTRGNKTPVLALILLPTRELAMQVLEQFHKICPTTKQDAVLVCGGLSENTQIEQISRGPRLIVATPGRLEDFLRRKAVNLRDVDMLVLDEVDRMLDMGFLPAIKRIVGSLPKDRQTMCYSATLDANIREIVKDYVQSPVRVEIGTASRPSDRVELRVYTVMQDQKLSQLDKMLTEEEGTYLAGPALCRSQVLRHGPQPRPRRHRRRRPRHRHLSHRARRQLRPAQRLGRLRPPHRPHRPRRRQGRCDDLRYAARKGRRPQAGARAQDQVRVA